MTKHHRDEGLRQARVEYAAAEKSCREASNVQDRRSAEDDCTFWARQINYFQSSAVTPEIDWMATYAAEDKAAGR